MFALVNVNSMDVVDTIHKEKKESRKQFCLNPDSMNLEVNLIVKKSLSLTMEKNKLNLKKELSYKNFQSDILNYQKDVFKKHTDIIAKKKQSLIISKIKKYIPDFNLEKEAERINKRLEKVVTPSTETYYLNLDSAKIRVITFIRTPPKLLNTDKGCSISILESYY